MSDAVELYFDLASKALREAGIAWPVLLLDGDRLDRNLDNLAAIRPKDKSLRIVAKSLPVPQLLQHAAARLATNRMMTFSVKMLEQVDALEGSYHQLLGKPVPAAALQQLLDKGEKGRDLACRTVWLADTLERINQYEALAAARGVTLELALEIDVGLRRGGVYGTAEINAALKAVKSAGHLTFAGLMGYEPHLPALPQWLGIQRSAMGEFHTRYSQALEIAQSVFGAQVMAGAILNTAGSKTIAERMVDSRANDFCVGSLLVRPLDFDKVKVPRTFPALFIATPVLKRVDPLAIPGFGSGMMAHLALGGGAKRGVYIHGGNWLADPAYPAGLGYSGVIGRSSNQELLVTKRDLALQPDDFVFLRPRQSEAVMLQFGPIAVLRDGRISQMWETFGPTA